MRKICKGLLIVLSLYAGTCQGQEYARVSTNALDFEISAYRLPVLSDRQGYLEKSDLSIGTILKSHHFRNRDFNETHNGIYLSFNEWSLGSYTNSGDEHSVFVTYNPRIYVRRSFQMNLVAGVANGYEGWKYAQDGYLPMLGLSAQWMYLKTLLSPELVALGLELPLN